MIKESSHNSGPLGVSLIRISALSHSQQVNELIGLATSISSILSDIHAHVDRSNPAAKLHQARSRSLIMQQ